MGCVNRAIPLYHQEGKEYEHVRHQQKSEGILKVLKVKKSLFNIQDHDLEPSICFGKTNLQTLDTGPQLQKLEDSL